MGVRRRGSQRQQKRAAQTNQDEAGLTATQAMQKASQANMQTDTPKFIPTFSEVVAAIESLYADDLKPFGRILRKRVGELAAAASSISPDNVDSLCDVDIKNLLVICEEGHSLVVEPEEGGDWSVLIAGRHAAFVDVYSSTDAYPPGMWGAAAAYFQTISGDDMYLPGGRYSCAQALQARNLAFLQGRSLGQVCHIVQLAISQKKLLGYLNGSVVPYEYSQSKLKEQCAQLNAPCTVSSTAPAGLGAAGGASRSEGNLDTATWDTARQHMRDILKSAARLNPGMVGTVPLSNVKRLFRSKFHTELSETRLGHSKLSELLQDDRFGDICTVQLQGHGYMVIQVGPQEDHTISLLDALSDEIAVRPYHKLSLEQSLPQFCPQEFCPQEFPTSIDNASRFVDPSPSATYGKEDWPLAGGYIGNLVQRTFIHASLPPPTPPPNARRRSASLPKDVGSDKSLQQQALGYPCPGLVRSNAGGDSGETESTTESGAGSTADEPEVSQSLASLSTRPSLDDPLKVVLRECCVNTIMEPMKIKAPVTTDPWDFVGSSEPCHRLQFCPDEPLALEEAGVFLDGAPFAQTPTPMGPSAHRWHCLSPSLSVKDGSVSMEGPLIQGENGELRRRLQFCPDEPLALEEAGVFLDSSHLAQTPTPMYRYSRPSVPRWDCNSPASFVKDGHVGSIALSRVQNTFIHSPLPPPTPLRVGASRRSRSLPKNVGSDKNMWEATCQALGCSQGPHEQQERVFNAGDCGPTPSVYGDSMSPNVSTNFAFGSVLPPPSPALTASPTCTPTGSKSQRFMNSCMWPTTASDPPNVISLASLLQ